MLKFIKNEIVFSIALVCAVITAFFNPPSAAYFTAIDFRTLVLLFCLMGVSEGLKDSGLFARVSTALEIRASNRRRLALFLVLLVFFSSMLFTNDVSLLMFVPFTLMIMSREKVDEGFVIKVIVLETIAANLGSMTTPVGNPQNIYICSFFNLDAPSFFTAILPYSVISLVLTTGLLFLMLKDTRTLEKAETENLSLDRKKVTSYLIFLILALFTVFRVLDYRLLFALEVLYLIIFDRKTLMRIDYILLLTFVCFFIFSANLQSIDSISRALSSLMASHGLETSILVSQVISNVPAAIVLSPFASSFQDVLLGTDLGGLGTPVASLASLISLKFYFKRPEGQKGRYMMVFLISNFALLALLYASALILG